MPFCPGYPDGLGGCPSLSCDDTGCHLNDLPAELLWKAVLTLLQDVNAKPRQRICCGFGWSHTTVQELDLYHAADLLQLPASDRAKDTTAERQKRSTFVNTLLHQRLYSFAVPCVLSSTPVCIVSGRSTLTAYFLLTAR